MNTDASTMTRPLAVCTAVAYICLLSPMDLSAHHSVSAWFERDGRQEIQGIITEVRWVNPHVLFFVRVANERGEESIWEIETQSVSGISRWGITEDLLAPGDYVRVSGWPSKRGRDNIFARNVLLPSGQELLFGGDPLYSDETLRGAEFVDATNGVAAEPERGIFRVWSQGQTAGWLFPEGFTPGFDVRNYPLTEAALAAYDNFNYLEQDPTIDCQPKGMPVIMEQPYPMEFIDAGDRVLLHIEEYDQERTIYLRNVPEEADQPHSLHGFSIGRMVGRDLHVKTTKINSGTFDTVGIPLSLEASLEERFVPSADGSTLDYYLTVNDPVYLTAPVNTHKQYIYLPGAQVGQYDCQI